MCVSVSCIEFISVPDGSWVIFPKQNAHHLKKKFANHCSASISLAFTGEDPNSGREGTCSRSQPELGRNRVRLLAWCSGPDALRAARLPLLTPKVTECIPVTTTWNWAHLPPVTFTCPQQRVFLSFPRLLGRRAWKWAFPTVHKHSHSSLSVLDFILFLEVFENQLLGSLLDG